MIFFLKLPEGCLCGGGLEYIITDIHLWNSKTILRDMQSSEFSMDATWCYENIKCSDTVGSFHCPLYTPVTHMRIVLFCMHESVHFGQFKARKQFGMRRYSVHD